jgi:protein-tyrosine phosphatase
MKIKRILFVCLGNICRSPAAEAIFKKIADDIKLEVEVDSAGTSAWHAGERADARMRKHARERGYNITSLSRAFDEKTDFDNFDMIIAMDDSNYHTLKDMARTSDEELKIIRMGEFIIKSGYDYIPDPYYGGDAGFELVIDLLEKGSTALLKQLKDT